jgi:hypothetical protein
MESSRSYPLGVEQAFDRLLPLPLEQLFDRRHGPIPAVRGTDGPAEPWGTAGQVRTVRMADGGTMHEELTRIDRPQAFAYTLSRVTGPMRPLASHVDGEWLFEVAGDRTRITWRWTMYPASALAAPLLPLFRRFWRGFAKHSLERLEPLLLAADRL